MGIEEMSKDLSSNKTRSYTDSEHNKASLTRENAIQDFRLHPHRPFKKAVFHGESPSVSQLWAPSTLFLLLLTGPLFLALAFYVDTFLAPPLSI